VIFVSKYLQLYNVLILHLLLTYLYYILIYCWSNFLGSYTKICWEFGKICYAQTCSTPKINSETVV